MQILDWLFPQRCLICQQPTQQLQICSYCLQQYDFLDAQIDYNLLLRSDVLAQFKTDHLDALYAIDWYQPPLSNWIKQLKYQGSAHYRAALTQIVREYLQQLSAQPQWRWPDIIAPVPLARSRLVKRGFNQSALVWQDGVPRSLYSPNLLSRIKVTKAQASLNRRQRVVNLKGAFALNEEVKGKAVAIVDDVMTTGSTFAEISKMLKAQGAAEVHAWAVCLRKKT